MSNWWRGRSSGFFRVNLFGPDPECHYCGKHDDRNQAEIWRAALQDGYLFATITAGHARSAARLAAEAQYREQRRQALAAVFGALLVIIILLFVAAT